MAETLAITCARDDDRLKVWHHRADSDRLVVVFSGVGAAEGQSYDFAASATADGLFNAIFIADPNRSWLNRDGIIEEICSEILTFQADVSATHLSMLGHSMGGYSAMILPGFLPVENAVAFAPQVSVHPAVAGDDRRWRIYRRHISDHRIRHVADHMTGQTQYYVFYGATDRDQLQRDRLPIRRNVDAYFLPGLGHGLPRVLRNRGVLSPLARAAIEGRRRKVRLIMRAQGAEREGRRGPTLPPYSEIKAAAQRGATNEQEYP